MTESVGGSYRRTVHNAPVAAPLALAREARMLTHASLAAAERTKSLCLGIRPFMGIDPVRDNCLAKFFICCGTDLDKILAVYVCDLK